MQYTPIQVFDEDWNVVREEHILIDAGLRAGILKPSPEIEAQLLILSMPQSSHTPLKRRKRGMTGDARRKIRNAVFLMERKYSAKRLTFCTITLPTLSPSFRRYLHLNWGNFKRQVIQQITRRLKKAGSPLYVVEVSEISFKRYAKYGELYLHMHLVWANTRTSPRSERSAENPCRAGRGNAWAIDIEWLRPAIHSILLNFQEKTDRFLGGVDKGEEEVLPLPRVEVARVKKSVSGYMAKYLSKAQKGLKELLQAFPELEEEIPYQWYYLGGGIRKWVLAEISPLDTLSADAINFLSDSAGESKEYLLYSYAIILVFDAESSFLAGRLGKLTRKGVEFIRSYAQSAA